MAARRASETPSYGAVLLFLPGLEGRVIILCCSPVQLGDYAHLVHWMGLQSNGQWQRNDVMHVT